MAHNWDTDAPWNANALRVRNKRTGQSGTLQGYDREKWHQAQRHPVHGWDAPVGDTPYFFTYRAERLTTLVWEIGLDDRILVADSMLGFLVEALKDAGYTNTFGITGWQALQNRVDTEARGDVVITKKDLRGANTIPNIKAALLADTGGETFDWVVTDELLQRLADPEVTFLGNALPQFLSGGRPESAVIHLVIPSEIPGFDENGNPIMVPLSQDPDYFHRTLAGYDTLTGGAQTIISTYGDWEVY